MTPEQRDRVTAVIVAELTTLRTSAVAAGACPADVDAELDRRRVALEQHRR